LRDVLEAVDTFVGLRVEIEHIDPGFTSGWYADHGLWPSVPPFRYSFPDGRCILEAMRRHRAFVTVARKHRQSETGIIQVDDLAELIHSLDITTFSLFGETMA